MPEPRGFGWGGAFDVRFSGCQRSGRQTGHRHKGLPQHKAGFREPTGPQTCRKRALHQALPQDLSRRLRFATRACLLPTPTAGKGLRDDNSDLRQRYRTPPSRSGEVQTPRFQRLAGGHTPRLMASCARALRMAAGASPFDATVFRNAAVRLTPRNQRLNASRRKIGKNLFMVKMGW